LTIKPLLATIRYQVDEIYDALGEESNATRRSEAELLAG
jgi:hypothetical protein